MECLFYCVTISVIMWTTGAVPFSGGDLLKTVVCIFSREPYWFATTYIVLLLLSPFLNIAIRAMSQKQLQWCIFLLLAVFCLWKNVLPLSVTLDDTNGHGIIWFVCLYFVAAYLRLYYRPRRSGAFYAGIYVLTALLAFASHLVIERTPLASLSFMFYEYSSITIFVASVGLFLAFLKLDIKGPRLTAVILTVASCTFGVYLIHEQFLLRGYLWEQLVQATAWLASPWFIPYSFGIIVGIFAVCVLIDWLRQKTIGRLERGAWLDRLCSRIASLKWLKGQESRHE